MSMRCKAYDIALPDATKLRDVKALKEIGDNATEEVVRSAAAKALRIERYLPYQVDSSKELQLQEPWLMSRKFLCLMSR